MYINIFARDLLRRLVICDVKCDELFLEIAADTTVLGPVRSIAG